MGVKTPIAYNGYYTRFVKKSRGEAGCLKKSTYLRGDPSANASGRQKRGGSGRQKRGRSGRHEKGALGATKKGDVRGDMKGVRADKIKRMGLTKWAQG